MFFNGWLPLIRILVVGLCAYIVLIWLLRMFGKRSLSKFNAFDFVVTVAIGSTLATVLISRETVLAEGVVAFALLFSLQYVVTWLSIRSPTFNRLVKSEPSLLHYRGEFLRRMMRDERVTEGEILSAVREAGISSLELVEAVVLETNGTITALKRSDMAPSSLQGVHGRPPGETP